MGFLLLLVALLGEAHPNSWSRSRVEVRGQHLVLRTELQQLSLLEVLPGLDVNGDGLIGAVELEPGLRDVEEYVLSHYTFWTGTSAEPGSGTRLRGALLDASTELTPDPFEPDLVHLELSYEADADIEDLRVEMILFAEVPDNHLDGCTVDWNGLQEIDLTFSLAYPVWRLPPELAPVRRGPAPWALRGARAGATSWVALGLVLALTLAARSRPALVGVAATTALAVPAGICLGALGALPLEPRFVDLVAALSVAYVAATNTLVRKPRTLWPESVLFGVVQGASIGAALAIAPMLEEMRWEASPDGTVVVFAVGLGLVAAAVAPLLGLGRRLPGLERGRVVLSALLALAGLGAFAQRAGWIPL